MTKGRPRESRRSWGSQRRRRLQRAVGTRLPLPVFVVVCDDSVTAPRYFEAIKREVKARVTVHVVTGGVDVAVAQLRKLGDEDEDTKNDVWVLMDLEGEPRLRERAVEEKQRGERERVKVALSDPCYEVWTLMHLKDTGESFTDCKQVTRLVMKCWREAFGEKKDSKTHLDYGKIIDLRQDAVRRAKQHRGREDGSWTEVYQVVERIDSLAQRDAP